MKKGVGDVFQQETKYKRGELPAGGLDWRNRPAPYKRYTDVPTIALPAPACDQRKPFWEVIKKRRSLRNFSNEPLPSRALSHILWASQGITQVIQGFSLRTAPSAGALYPLETYLVIHNVAEIAAGVYHYAVETHELEELRRGDFRASVARAALDQEIAYRAPVVFIWTAIFERSIWKYKQRAYRYVYLDAGHIAQNVALSAVALGLGSCQIAALYDEEANELLGIDGENESTLYMTVVGQESTP
jgi:SagB-type dehydrogenase family enzyme